MCMGCAPNVEGSLMAQLSYVEGYIFMLASLDVFIFSIISCSSSERRDRNNFPCQELLHDIFALALPKAVPQLIGKIATCVRK